MAISKQEAARKRITRGSILYMLYVSQSAPMRLDTIELSMLSDNPQIAGELVPQINYLIDRGYIKDMGSESPSINPQRCRLVRITDKGQDVMEGITLDPGIILPGER